MLLRPFVIVRHQVLWAHNSHLGDARHADSGWRRGQLNVGQLVREAYPRPEVWAVGFSTHTGRCGTWRERGGEGVYKVGQVKVGAYSQAGRSR